MSWTCWGLRKGFLYMDLFHGWSLRMEILSWRGTCRSGRKAWASWSSASSFLFRIKTSHIRSGTPSGVDFDLFCGVTPLIEARLFFTWTMMQPDQGWSKGLVSLKWRMSLSMASVSKRLSCSWKLGSAVFHHIAISVMDLADSTSVWQMQWDVSGTRYHGQMIGSTSMHA